MIHAPSLGFTFWNLNKKPIAHLVRKLVDEQDIDVVLLAENNIDPAALLDALNNNQPRTYFLDDFPSKKITLLTRLPQGSITPISDDLGISIRHITPPLGNSILLVSAHFPSKLHRDKYGHLAFAAQVANLIKSAEDAVGHTRTVITGDLNMNPFEPGIVAANGLHASMSRKIAEKASRTVDGIAYPFLYNPMWNRFGDETQGPPGTFHYGPNGHMSFCWNMFDQVLLRPSLLSSFKDEHLSIISKIGTTSLVNKHGVPDKSFSSDHLPIAFRLQLTN